MKSSLFLFFLIYVCYAAPFRNQRKSKGKEFFTLGTCRDVKILELFTPEILSLIKEIWGHPKTTSPVCRGAKLTIWGDMRGVDYNFFENAIFNLETDFSLTFEIVTNAK